MTDAPVAFYCRARPQKSDAWPIFQDAKRAFIGYPMVRKGAQYDPHNLAACLVHPGCDDAEWAEQCDRPDYRRDFASNRNLVRDVTPGSIVVIPRPESGLAHLGRISGPFEIVNDPQWLEAYMNLRDTQGAGGSELEYQHAADVAQGWPVEEWVSVPLAAIPGWIRRSLYGRSTFGRLRSYPLDKSETAHQALGRILESKGRAALRGPTFDPKEVTKRLFDTLTASAFEHLVVNLMQLEYPDEVWMHTGGPGDGGVDGMAVGEDGETAAVLQCKLYGAQEAWSRTASEPDSVRQVFAVLGDDGGASPEDGVQRLDADRIAELVLKHARDLPEAKSMRIIP